ncbi:MAG: hypothetical protein AAFO97_15275 [Pseudomonadota bacterium]
MKRLTFLIAALPTSARAEVCDKVRPFWTPGAQATSLDELIGLMATPPSLVLLVLTALAVRFRHQWGALVVVLAWTAWVSVIAFVGFGGETQALAMAEGCIGSPALFIAVVTAICVGMILYTAPRETRL